MSVEKPTRPQPIPVRAIRLAKSTDIPGRGMTESCSAGRKAGLEYAIAYEPWLRHHRVTVIEPTTVRSVLIPESAVLCWEPLD